MSYYYYYHDFTKFYLVNFCGIRFWFVLNIYLYFLQVGPFLFQIVFITKNNIWIPKWKVTYMHILIRDSKQRHDLYIFSNDFT